MNLTEAGRRQLDLFEQLAVTGLYAWLVIRLLSGAIGSGGLLAVSLLLLSEDIVCILLVLRRPILDISVRLQDWGVAEFCFF